MSTSEYPAERFRRTRLSGLGETSAVKAGSADVWVLVALVVLATVIRIVTIDNQSFWQDEALTAYEAKLSFGAMINTVVHVETTPPLYFVLAWLVAHVLGSGEVALRSISTIAGIAMVPIAYYSTRELVSRWAGVVAAAFVTVNPYLIWFSQEARAYMLLAALTGASFLWFARTRREPSPRNVVWWTICSALALMTHFFAGFAVAPEALWLLWISRTRLVGAAVAVVALTQMAMLPFAITDTAHGVNWISSIPRLNRVSDAIAQWGVSSLYRGATVNQRLAGGAAVLAIAAALVVVGGDRRTRDGAKVAAVIAGCVALAPLALGLVGQDYFLARNVIPAFIPLATVLAAACAAPRTRLLGGALALALLAMFFVADARVQSRPYLERPDWRAVAHALDPATVPRAILTAGGTTAQPLKIYLPHVDWTEPRTHELWIREVDVVGAIKRMPLLPVTRRGPRALLEPLTYSASGSSPPRSIAPDGARLLRRFHIDSWIVARFALRRPMRTSIDQLTKLAPAFFRRTPQALLVFFQPPRR